MAPLDRLLGLVSTSTHADWDSGITGGYELAVGDRAVVLSCVFDLGGNDDE